MNKNFSNLFYLINQVHVCGNQVGGLKSPSCSHRRPEEPGVSFDFSAYRQPILQVLLQHERERHVVSEKGKRAEPFSQEQRRNTDPDALLLRLRKGCRHKLKESEKTQAIRGGGDRNHSRIAGVSYDKVERRWVASWSENGKTKKKYFSTRQYGAQGAYREAVALRQEMVAKGAPVKHAAMNRT